MTDIASKTLKQKGLAVPDKIKRLFYSDAFLIVFALVSFVSWYVGIPVIGYAFVSLTATLILLLLDDITPIFGVLFFAVPVVADPTNIGSVAVMVPIFVPTVFAIAYRLIVSRPRFVFGKMFMPQLGVSIVLLVGGIAVIDPSDWLRVLPMVFLLGFGVLIFYVLFLNYSNQNPYVQVSVYTSKVFAYVGLLCVAEIVTFYLRSGASPADWGSLWLDLGWGIHNNVATILVMSAPLSLYLASKHKFCLLYVILASINYLGIILSFSRGGILMGAVAFIPALVLSVAKTEYRKNMVFSLTAVFFALFIAYISLFDFANSAIASLLGQGFGVSGRDNLASEAWQLFKQNPIFGAGMGYVGNNLGETKSVALYFFHSTVLQVIASMGLFGVAGYVWFYIRRYKIMLRNITKDPYKWFLMLALFSFEAYSLIDTGTFVPMPFMILLMALNAMIEKQNNMPTTGTYTLNRATYIRSDNK